MISVQSIKSFWLIKASALSILLVGCKPVPVQDTFDLESSADHQEQSMSELSDKPLTDAIADTERALFCAKEVQSLVNKQLIDVTNDSNAFKDKATDESMPREMQKLYTDRVKGWTVMISDWSKRQDYVAQEIINLERRLDVLKQNKQFFHDMIQFGEVASAKEALSKAREAKKIGDAWKNFLMKCGPMSARLP
jgi:hypothetical protein